MTWSGQAGDACPDDTCWMCGDGFRKKSNVDYQFFSTVMFVRQHLLRERPLF